MNSLTDSISHHFENHIQVAQQSQLYLTESLVRAGEMVANAMLNGKKVLCCGNGGSAADAQHFSAEMLNRFMIERPALPAIALTTDSSTLTAVANDYHFDEVFSKQIKALGQPDDILLAITTSGKSPNMLAAVDAAHHRGMQVLALTGHDGGPLRQRLLSSDIEITIPSDHTARIQEMHIFCLHCLCDMVDQQLFSHEELAQ